MDSGSRRPGRVGKGSYWMCARLEQAGGWALLSLHSLQNHWKCQAWRDINLGPLLIYSSAPSLMLYAVLLLLWFASPLPAPHKHARTSLLPTGTETGLRINRREGHGDLLPPRASVTGWICADLCRWVTFTLWAGGASQCENGSTAMWESCSELFNFLLSYLIRDSNHSDQYRHM